VKYLFAALLVLFAFGGVQAAETVFLPGSAVGLVPPAGMSPAKEFTGFQDETNGASILAAVFPPAAYPEMATGFSDDAKLAQQGITAMRRESLTIGGHPALFIVGRQRTPAITVNKWILLIGHPKSAALLTAQLTDAARAAYPDAAIRNALMSVSFRDPPSREQRAAALPFTTPALGRFRIVDTLAGNGLILSDGPGDTDPERQHASFIAVLMTTRPAPGDREAFSRAQFLGMRAIQVDGIDSTSSTEVAGRPVQEIVGRGQARSAVPLKIVQWTVFAPGATLLMLGTARPTGFEQLYPQFLALRDGIHPK